MTQRIEPMLEVTCHPPAADTTQSTAAPPPLDPLPSPTLPPSPLPPSSVSRSIRPAAAAPSLSVIAIESERVCLYQQFDDSYPLVLTPHLSRGAFYCHINRINAHCRRAAQWYALSLLAFLTFALGPILLGAAVNEHALTGVDEEVGVAMLLLGAVAMVASVVWARVNSRRMLLKAVEEENEVLRGSVPEMRFRLEHETVLLPIKHMEEGAGGVQAGEQQQQQLESSEYRLLLEIAQSPGGAANSTLVNAAIAEATLLSMSSHFTLDPTAVLHHHHHCTHCAYDSPHSVPPQHSVTPLSPVSATPAAMSPLLTAHRLSSLPDTAHVQPSSAPTPEVREIRRALTITVPQTDDDLQPAVALPAAVTAQ